MKKIGILIGVDGVTELDYMRGTDEEQLLDIENRVATALLSEGIITELNGSVAVSLGDVRSEEEDEPMSAFEHEQGIAELDNALSNFEEYCNAVREGVLNRLSTELGN